MTEQASLLIDVGNMLGVLVIIGCMFVLAAAGAMLWHGIQDIINKR